MICGITWWYQPNLITCVILINMPSFFDVFVNLHICDIINNLWLIKSTIQWEYNYNLLNHAPSLHCCRPFWHYPLSTKLKSWPISFLLSSEKSTFECLTKFLAKFRRLMVMPKELFLCDVAVAMTRQLIINSRIFWWPIKH